MRDKQGRFQKGRSGNPTGRPKDTEGVAELARSFATEAIETLVSLMREGEASTRVRAAQALLDRGFGKPTTTLDGKLEVGRSVTAMHLDALRDAMDGLLAAQEGGLTLPARRLPIVRAAEDS